MKRLTAALVLLIIATIGYAQPSNSFPASFTGHWQGTLHWYAQGVDTPRTVHMELDIRPHPDSAGQYTWHIIYGKPGQDNRPYLLKPVDAAKGHWVIDEVNGILLDQYWTAGKFAGAFTVGNTTIVNSYWIENGQLQVEFYSYTARPLVTTGKGTEDSPRVDSYAMRAYQRATLRKK